MSHTQAITPEQRKTLQRILDQSIAVWRPTDPHLRRLQERGYVIFHATITAQGQEALESDPVGRYGVTAPRLACASTQETKA